MAPFAGRLHMSRERTGGLEYFQAPHATMTDSCVNAGVEVLLDHCDGLERTMPVNFDLELEQVGWRQHLRAFYKRAQEKARRVVSLEIHSAEMTVRSVSRVDCAQEAGFGWRTGLPAGWSRGCGRVREVVVHPAFLRIVVLTGHARIGRIALHTGHAT